MVRTFVDWGEQLVKHAASKAEFPMVGSWVRDGSGRAIGRFHFSRKDNLRIFVRINDGKTPASQVISDRANKYRVSHAKPMPSPCQAHANPTPCLRLAPQPS